MRLQNDRHAVVDGLHDFVGSGSEDGESLQRCAFARLPTLPESGEGIGFAGVEGDGEGLFCLGVNLLPLVKCVGGHQAAARLQCLAEGGLAGGFLGARVKGREVWLGVLGPEGHQPPALQSKLSATANRIKPHHWLNALWSDVIAGGKEGNPAQFHIKPAGEFLQ